MKPFRIVLALAVAMAVGLFLGFPPVAHSHDKSIKIELIFDFSGPFSAAGSLLNDRPSVYEVVDGKFAIVYPKAFANSATVLPLPASSPFAAR